MESSGIVIKASESRGRRYGRRRKGKSNHDLESSVV